MQVMRNDPPLFFKFYRMMPDKFDQLHALVRDDLTKEFLCREPLSSEQRLAITLRYLSSGSAIKDVALAFRVGPQTCRKVIHETCRALWSRLRATYLPVPTNEQWLNIADGFKRRWNFPNCLGAVDGKHVHIKAPPNSGSTYFNYKKSFSIVLMAVVDANYKFVMVDVGAPGRHSDGGVFKASEFGRRLENETLELPGPAKLPKSTKVTPHVFVGDEAFQLRHDFMRPFPGADLEPDHNVFNYRLSRARRIVENGFGILAARWRVLLGRLNLLPQNAEFVVLACCVLHNFLCAGREQAYMPAEYVDTEDKQGNVTLGRWRSEVDKSHLSDLQRTSAKNFKKTAGGTRSTFVEYFMKKGAVRWQWHTRVFSHHQCNEVQGQSGYLQGGTGSLSIKQISLNFLIKLNLCYYHIFPSIHV
ncbi:protein ANTAGONIST OF LIKE HETEROCHROMATIN PROTEIN 1-like [Ixodes scapularis]|uniref:protein ANTAGONIST OF LIKE HETEROCHROMATIN PROTEIN 1-like n=1 Tax=Ixodes scapularis TaxID=6945 RepID=UPI001AD61237|nr:protein ANTAGONIST OF LIKE HETEROCHROMATIN PROTEIN 1-like [Ixodes scapularis]